jgi:hypothetical protein
LWTLPRAGQTSAASKAVICSNLPLNATNGPASMDFDETSAVGSFENTRQPG